MGSIKEDPGQIFEAIIFFSLLQNIFRFSDFQITPTEFICGGKFIGVEVFVKLRVKNTHSSRFHRMGGVLQHSTGLLKRDARKPLNKLRKLLPILDIFE
jgi:hypothetical protein